MYVHQVSSRVHIREVCDSNGGEDIICGSTLKMEAARFFETFTRRDNPENHES